MRIALAAALIALASPTAAQRAPLTGPTTFNVSATGLDFPACGTVANPCRTKQGAFAAIALVDGMNNTVTIADPTCADSGPLSITASSLVGIKNPIAVTGNATTPCPVVTSASQIGFYVEGPAVVSLTGFRVDSSGSTGPGIYASYGSQINIMGPFDHGPSATDQILATGGVVLEQGPITISGGAGGHHLHCFNYAVYSATAAFTIKNAPHFGQRFVGNGGCDVGFGGVGAWATFSYPNGPATGLQFYAHRNGFMGLATPSGPVVLPGAGTSAVGANVDESYWAQDVHVGSGAMYLAYPGSPDAAMTYNGYDIRWTSPRWVILQNPYHYATPSPPGPGCVPASIC